MAKKTYGVRKGRKTGVYDSWAECKKQIDGFSGAEYKGFSSREEACAYVEGAVKEEQVHTEAVAYVDGSYQGETGRFSCGVVFFYRGKEEHFSRAFQDPAMAAMHNVAGEIKGAQLAMEYCLEQNIPSLTIYHDYEGIAKWCTGAWQAKKPGTIAYRDFYQAASSKVEIYFIKVKGHSGDTYNELADELAKKALGIS
jgi:ribonuclease HI